jgi:hypothetical protein
MNTRNKQDQQNRRQRTRQEQRPKKRGQSPKTLHGLKLQEHEHPEMRMTD